MKAVGHEVEPWWMGFSSVQFSHSVVSDPLWHCESWHARPPCPSPTPGVHSDSGPSSQWCHPATSSSVVPFSSCPQSLPASESFPMSQLFAWGGQNTGVSALNGISALLREPWKSFYHVKIQQEDGCLWDRKPALNRHQIWWSWTSQPPEPWEINICCLAMQSRCFVMEAQSDYTNLIPLTAI